MPNAMPPSEDGVPERAGTSMSVSDVAGMGEESMMSFINMHMKSILQPFAENVEELHNTVYNLTGSINEITAKIDENASQINDIFPALRSDLTVTHELAAGTESQLRKTIAEKQLLEETVEKMVERRIPDIESKIPPLKDSIVGFGKDLAETRNMITTCQVNEEKNRTGLVKISETGERLTGDISDLQQAREGLIEKVNSHKTSFDEHVKEMESLPRSLEELRAKLDIFNKTSDGRFGRNDERFLEIQKQLVQYRQDFHQVHDAAVKMLCGRLDAHDSNKEEGWQKMKRLEVSLTEQNTRIVENGENFNKLMRLMESRHAAELLEVGKNLRRADADINENRNKTKDIHNILHTRSSEVNGESKHWLNHLQEDMDLAHRRSRRVEKVLGLEEMTLANYREQEKSVVKGGILLTEKQVAEYKEIFDRYDTDGSGHIDSPEVGDVLRSLGYEPDEDILKKVLNEIDTDKSGEICFDEFCGMMSNMLGPDGKVDLEGYLDRLTSAATREANMDTAMRLIPVLQEELKRSKEIMEEEKIAIDSLRTESIQRVVTLEGEVEKCKRGLDLTQEYWKGFSRGLKETKKSVGKEGEGLMIPSATKLRNLPPLKTEVRPITAPVGRRPTTAPVGYVE